MTLAALIILGDDRPTAPVLGMAWPEFQMRCAVRAGARHLVLVADRVSRDVVEAVDRLRAEGLATTLARNAAEVADLFHPDEAVLLMTGSAVVSGDKLAELFEAAKPTLLCVEAEHAGPGHELIDARSHWVGIARIDGAQIRATATMVGDWDLGSILLRKAVASRAVRLTLTTEDVLIDASDAAGAVAASRVLISVAQIGARGWGMRWIVEPVAHLVTRSFPAALPALARFGPWGAITLFALCPLLVGMKRMPVALAVFLVALLIAASAKIATQVTGIAQQSGRWAVIARDMSAALSLVLIAFALLPDLTPAVLATGIVAFTAMADRLSASDVTPATPWSADAAGHALILFAGSLFGPFGLLIGLAFCAIHGLASLAFLQNRLSRVLTSLR